MTGYWKQRIEHAFHSQLPISLFDKHKDIENKKGLLAFGLMELAVGAAAAY